MTDMEQFRYTLEHEILPNMFYKNKSDMFNAILDKGGKFFSDLYLIYGPVTDIVYTENDFKISAKRCMSDNKMLYFLVVDMPEPTMPLLCQRVYFCCEVESEFVRYYTSELGENGSYLMCSWNKHHIHTNYDTAPEDEEQEFRRIGNIFLKYILNNKKSNKNE